MEFVPESLRIHCRTKQCVEAGDELVYSSGSTQTPVEDEESEEDASSSSSSSSSHDPSGGARASAARLPAPARAKRESCGSLHGPASCTPPPGRSPPPPRRKPPQKHPLAVPPSAAQGHREPERAHSRSRGGFGRRGAWYFSPSTPSLGASTRCQRQPHRHRLMPVKSTKPALPAASGSARAAIFACSHQQNCPLGPQNWSTLWAESQP